MPALALIPLAAALACVAVILTLLRKPEWLPLDRPNERSLHATPTPRIGGLGIMAGVLVAFLLIRAEPLAALAGALAVVSFVDDRWHVPIALRFGAHVLAAVVFVVVLAPDVPRLWQGVLVLAIVWMTNLYNFMDGSDGLAGGMALFGFGAYALGASLAGDTVMVIAAGSIAAAAAAFLAFNFPPAKVFMGDAGSIPLGFLAAALGLIGWYTGRWPLWFPLLAFSPFIVDASFTLARRALRRERVWEAHKTHYYQRLVQLGWGHVNTALAEYALMAACGTAALWALAQPPAVQAGTLVAAALAYVALAAAIDAAWRRHRRGPEGDARAH
ncbi:MAG: glycosyltransferase family 4 protein [Planctomycetes bacterium]|nr:glycosyltransferase family 4 protein [Planctomycetota bacterium]